MRRENPYTRLKRVTLKYISSVEFPRKRLLWKYPRESQIMGSYNLEDLYQRSMAAQALGYYMRIEADSSGLYVYYVKEPDEVPWELRY